VPRKGGVLKPRSQRSLALLICLLRLWPFSFEEESQIIQGLTGIVRLRFLCIREAFLWFALHVER
jgi:hypothetical protein